MGCRGPATRGIPSIKRRAIVDPSGEKRGVSTLPFSSARLVGTPVAAIAVHTCAAGASPSMSARNATCFESGAQHTERSDSLPSTAIARPAPPEAGAIVSSPATRYATLLPSGDSAASSILFAVGMASKTVAAREDDAWAQAGEASRNDDTMTTVNRSQEKIRECAFMAQEYTGSTCMALRGVDAAERIVALLKIP